jgi:chemotaxis protein MotA
LRVRAKLPPHEIGMDNWLAAGVLSKLTHSMKIDIATVAGVSIGAIGLVAGLWLEGIHLYDLTQLTAIFIVFFGTAGAVLISMPLEQTKKALQILPGMIRNPEQPDRAVIEQLLKFSKAARLYGLLSLEKEAQSLADPYFRNAMQLAMDAVSADAIRSVLDAEVVGLRAQAEGSAAFYETAGGYAPTLGMAGAAIGLIQVMKHLEHIDQVGMGVAAAFVATIYGVLLANLVLLPVATKIRARVELRVRTCGLIQEGVLSIKSGVSPTLIRLRLEGLAQLTESSANAKSQSVLTAEIGRG